jgi:hypothetical protein
VHLVAGAAGIWWEYPSRLNDRAALL